MRKITEKAYYNWVNRIPFKQSNTQVKIKYNGDRELYLHGNCIAKEDNGIFLINHCNWETSTTRERLNIFPNVHIKINQGRFILNGNIMKSGWVCVN